MVIRISAEEGTSLTVIYTVKDGKSTYTEVWRGGSRSWRNNNPGNIRNSNFTRRHGHIGKAGGFAVFPDKETGKEALVSLLKVRSYQVLTLGGALNRYAPKSENDTEAYLAFIESITDISRDTPMEKMSDESIKLLADAIERFEGYFSGEIEEIYEESNEQTGQYVWKTMGDDKVRSSHADLDGEIFSYHNPPPEGNPGDAYGCRCQAIPINGSLPSAE